MKRNFRLTPRRRRNPLRANSDLKLSPSVSHHPSFPWSTTPNVRDGRRGVSHTNIQKHTQEEKNDNATKQPSSQNETNVPRPNETPVQTSKDLLCLSQILLRCLLIGWKQRWG